jgi:hypothetical protein
MEKQAVPYSEWPWWVRVIVTPSGRRIWDQTGVFYPSVLLCLIAVLTFFISGFEDLSFGKDYMPLFFLSLLFMQGWQYQAACWILIHSDREELLEQAVFKRIYYGFIVVLISAGPVLLHYFFFSK